MGFGTQMLDSVLKSAFGNTLLAVRLFLPFNFSVVQNNNGHYINYYDRYGD